MGAAVCFPGAAGRCIGQQSGFFWAVPAARGAADSGGRCGSGGESAADSAAVEGGGRWRTVADGRSERGV